MGLCGVSPPAVSPASSHLLFSSLDLSAEEIPGINTALSEFYSRLALWVPCQLLLVLHFCYGNCLVKTGPCGKSPGPWTGPGRQGCSESAHRKGCWCDPTGISCLHLSWEAAWRAGGTAWRSAARLEENLLQNVTVCPFPVGTDQLVLQAAIAVTDTRADPAEGKGPSAVLRGGSCSGGPAGG